MFVHNRMKSIGEANWQIDVGEDNGSQVVGIMVSVGVDIDLERDRSSGIHG